MSGHTKGTWRSSFKTTKTNNLGIYTDDGSLLATLDVHQLATPPVMARRKQDARLMAAAPELLAALIRCESCCTNDAVGQQARAAIAKAQP
jgi:hypothetical protein